MNSFWIHPLVWFVITGTMIWLCIYLPIKIKDDKARRLVYWFILIPASLVLMFYGYPAGLEVFRRFALS